MENLGNNNADKFKFTENTNSIKVPLKQLAMELAYNYFSNSFGNEYNTEIADCAQIFQDSDVQSKFKERWGNRERVRNILVVGAGAIYDAYKAIPIGEGLIEEVENFFKTKIQPIEFLKNKFEGEKQKIKDTTGQDKLTFENYLYILTKFFVTQTEMREKIKELVDFRHLVSLFNELVAHMLKHAFIDVVINFNFEETLDEAIREELGKNNYLQIISDGDCVPLENILINGRLQTPIYIKPHGTYSHKSTLRFTNNHYFELPNDIKLMLEGLLGGSCGKGNNPMKVNVILVGFAIESIEFNRILNEKLPSNSVIYHIDYNPSENAEKFFEKKGKQFDNFKVNALKSHTELNSVYIPISTAKFNISENKNKLTPTLGELFSVLWRFQHSFFHPAYVPRSIARHEILSYLLYRPRYLINPSDSNKLRSDRRFIHKHIEQSPDYFCDRLLVELFLTLNRSNGVLDVAEVLKGRSGFYYNKYLLLKPHNGKNKPTYTFYEFMRVLSDEGTDEEKAENMGNSYFGKNSNIFKLKSAFGNNDLQSLENFNLILNILSENLKNRYKDITIPNGYKLNENDFDPKELDKNKFLKLLDSFVYDLEKNLGLWYENFPISKDLEKRRQELTKLGRTITLFYGLLSNRHISIHFVINFLLHYNCIVYNGKDYQNTDTQSIDTIDKQTSNNENNAIVNDGNITMINELFRLLTKSWRKLYFIIVPNPSNPVNFLWESYHKRKVIHTNLANIAEINHLLIKKEWNVLLAVNETGTIFLNSVKYINHLAPGKKQELKNKLKSIIFFIICSYESVKQLYPEDYSYEKLIKCHKQTIINSFKEGELIIEDKNIIIMFLPYNQHNHHSLIFLNGLSVNSPKSNTNLIRSENESHKFCFDAVGSIYYTRRGLSNSIDPIYIGNAAGESVSQHNNLVKHDQEKLLAYFVGYVNKALNFEHIKRQGENIPSSKISNLLEKLQKNWSNNYIDIQTEEFLAMLYTEVMKPLSS